MSGIANYAREMSREGTLWRRDNLQLPNVVESEVLRPYTYHSPAIPKITISVCVPHQDDEGLQQNDTNHDHVEHHLGPNPETPLDPPEAVNADGLGANTKEEEVGQSQGVVRDDSVLKCRDHGDGGIK